MSATQWFLVGSGAILVGTAYVLVHEHRRKAKGERKRIANAPISKELLLEILTESGAHFTQEKVEQLRTIVEAKAKQLKYSEQETTQLYNEHFQQNLDQIINAVRQSKKVSEKAMDSSFREHQEDPDVQRAVQKMRIRSATVPKTLTPSKVKEIMNYNCKQLEQELKPVKQEMEAARRQGRQPQINEQVLLQMQIRIAAKVKSKFGVTDEQVMSAVEKLGMQEDPEFRAIMNKLQNILIT